MKYLHLIVTGVTGLLLIFGSLDMPDTGDPESPPSLHVSPRYIEQGYSETNTPNMVTAVLADYRGFDTLGETVVIFTAALGVILILRTRPRRGLNVITSQQSVIVKTVCRILVPFVQMFGLYVIMHGHSSPGGGFQGGVILGSSFILLSLGYGIDEVKRRFSLAALTVFTSFGVFLYAAIGILCLFLGANFLDYGILPTVEPRVVGSLGIEIGVGITVMAVMVSIFHDLITFE